MYVLEGVNGNSLMSRGDEYDRYVSVTPPEMEIQGRRTTIEGGVDVDHGQIKIDFRGSVDPQIQGGRIITDSVDYNRGQAERGGDYLKGVGKGRVELTESGSARIAMEIYREEEGLQDC